MPTPWACRAGVAYARDHQDIVRRWVSEGIKVRVWTVNTEEDADLLAELGVPGNHNRLPGGHARALLKPIGGNRSSRG
jgi:hypothetical protein